MRLTRTTLILIVANLACALAIWRSLPGPEAAAERALTFPLAPAWVEVEGAAGKLRLERAEGGWVVTQPFRWSANRWEVQRLLGELALIREAAPAAVRPPSGERWTVRAGAEAGPPVEATVLAETTAGGGRSALLDGGSRGRATGGEALIRALAQPPEAYRVDAVFSLAPFEVRALGVRLSRPGAEDRRWGMVLESRESLGRTDPAPAWRFEAPDNLAADPERTPKALAALADLRVARFLPPRAAPATEKPWLRLSLEGPARREVLLAWPEKDGLCEAVLEDNPGQPFLVAAAALGPWADPLAGLRSRAPLDFDPALARGITLRHLRSGRSLTLHRMEGAEGRWEMPVVPGSTATRRLDVSLGRARQFLRLLTDLRSDGAAAAGEGADWFRLSVEFPGGSLVHDLAIDPAAARLLVRSPAGVAACPTDLPLARWLSVEPGDWRSEVLTRLPAGTRVARLELLGADGSAAAKAELGPDGRWLAEGDIDAEGAARLASRLAVVQAIAFPPATAPGTRGTEWGPVLRVTDRSAAGASGSTETLRAYRLGRAAEGGATRMRDEEEGVVFVPEPSLAEALAPWTSP
jgi:hypothetical protein